MDNQQFEQNVAVLTHQRIAATLGEAVIGRIAAETRAELLQGQLAQAQQQFEELHNSISDLRVQLNEVQLAEQRKAAVDLADIVPPDHVDRIEVGSTPRG